MSVMDFHRVLLADRARMRAYSRAIAKVVKPGDRVIDLGAGTGILSFMAARAGASRVYAIEKERIVNMARNLAEINRLSDRISFIHADFKKVRPADIGRRADVLVSEMIGVFGIHERIVENFSEAARRLMKPQARFIPRRLRLFLAPVSSPAEARKLTQLRRVAGFDFSPAARIYANSEGWTTERKGHKFLAAGVIVADHVLGRPEAVAGSRGRGARKQRMPATTGAEVAFHVKRDARLDGYLGWFEAELADGVRISSKNGTHWPNLFLPVTGSPRVKEGDMLHTTLWVSRKFRYSWRTIVSRGNRALFDRCQSSGLANELMARSLGHL